MAEKVRLPLIPLTDLVVLPHMEIRLQLATNEARAALAAASDSRQLLLVPRTGERYGKVGTVAKLEAILEQGPDFDLVALVGRQRGVIASVNTDERGALWAEVTLAPDQSAPSERARELAREYRALLDNLLEARQVPQIAQFLRSIDSPSHLADLAGYSPDFSMERKLQLLEETDVEKRLEALIEWTRETLAQLVLKEEIRREVESGMERQQRDFFLRQQMAAIQRQLGDETSGQDYRERLAAAKLPDAVRKEAERELGRLERTSEQNPEHGWIRNYLDWILELPWGVYSEDNLDLAHARQVLDQDHYGLSDVKERIVEFLAVHKRQSLNPSGTKGAIITLVGPPGVGKTSIGESVAQALGRKFVRIALGGVHDEAEIRGHRRTYVGALPGRLVRALKEAGTMNPVIMLDEVDKLGHDFRGDPTSALLEVLDPAQNHTFRDHYLDLDVDLSQVLFIPTANVAEQVPGPLLDRMELIRMDGYSEAEKREIGRRHLWPRLLARTSFSPEDASISEGALGEVIGGYTREAGVRSLERELEALLRKLATRVEDGRAKLPIAIGPEEVAEWLGAPRFQSEVAGKDPEPGVATGLAVTATGGDILFIEATLIPSEEPLALTLTGQLGEVMKESAQIALSHLRANADRYGLGSLPDRGRVHIHIPQGAVPKDGPSAGVAMTMALASLFSGRPVLATAGMTGEITLQGKVLPIGGVRQKVLAAHRAGLPEVILPERNRRDADEIPEEVRKQVVLHFVERFEEALGFALAPASGSTVFAA